MVSPEKIQELRAVVNFWKFRVDESKGHLQKLTAREAAQADDDHCGRNFMHTLVDMKTRELSDSQRGLRRAQANLGRALELTTVTMSPVIDAALQTLSPAMPMAIAELNGMEHRRRA